MFCATENLFNSVTVVYLGQVSAEAILTRGGGGCVLYLQVREATLLSYVLIYTDSIQIRDTIIALHGFKTGVSQVH
jgi:hypothetical protein